MKCHLDGMLTVQELSAKLKISVRTVREWTQRRKIPFTRIHRRLYFDAGVVEKMLQRNAVEAVAATPVRRSREAQGGAEKGEQDQ